MDASNTNDVRLEVTVTSVGRQCAVPTVRSLLEHVDYDGPIRFLATLDRAYGVGPDERAEVLEFLRGVDHLDERIVDSRTFVLDEPAGLERSLCLLASASTARWGLHIEDDWVLRSPLPIERLVVALERLDVAAVNLVNDHLNRNGDFLDEAVPVSVDDEHLQLWQLADPHWAYWYMPLCPGLHDSRRWWPTLIEGLAAGGRDECPDERVRRYFQRRSQRPPVVWLGGVEVAEIGRDWLRSRGQSKNVGPAADSRLVVDTPLPPVRARLQSRSRWVLERAYRAIPGQTQTFQKRAAHYPPECPAYVDHGRGSRIWDADGNEYVDFVCGLGAIGLGHAHPAVVQRARERLSWGTSFSLPTQAEVDLAELLSQQIPGATGVRFVKTGADAVAAAIRLARATTGRDEVIGSGYHGWHDVVAGDKPGVPPAVSALYQRFDLEQPAGESALLQALEATRPAAVIVASPYSRQFDPTFLVEVRRSCTESGALLILDEVVTGFRLAPGGVGEQEGVTPDVGCYSKAVASGMPLGVIVIHDRALSMLGDLHVSTTSGTERLSIEVAKATVREMAASPYFARIDQLGRELKRQVVEGWSASSGDDSAPPIAGYPQIPFIVPPDPRVRGKGLAEAARRGLHLRWGPNFLTGAHSMEEVGALADFIVEMRRLWVDP